MKLAASLLFLTLTATAHPGVGIVMDSKGNVFYTDLTHVWKIEAAGKKSIAVHDVHTHELFMDDKDNLFGENSWYNGEAANTWGHYVWKLSPTGELVKIIPDTDGFRKDFSFVHDHLGRGYMPQGPVGCQHIARINTNKTTSIVGDQCLNNIRWMAAGSSGDLFLVDDGDVKQMDPSGHIRTVALDVPQPKSTHLFVNKNHYLGGITIDKDQNIYVSDFSARDVKRISKNGDVSIVIETSFPWSPSGLLINEATREFWVLEYSVTNDARVEKVDANGDRKVF